VHLGHDQHDLHGDVGMGFMIWRSGISTIG